MVQTADNSGGGRSGEGAAARLVARVGRRARAVLLAEAWLWALAAVVGAVFVLVVVDYVFRLPRGVRVLHLVALGYGVFVLWRRVVRPAVRFRPEGTEIALRIERAAEAARARDRLASGLELADGAAEGESADGALGASGLSSSMAQRAAADADVIAAGMGERRFVQTGALRRAGVVFVAVVVVVSGMGVVRPTLAGIGIARTVWPFAGTAWPKRTAVVDATGVEVQPIGEALAMRALLTKTNQAVGKTEVTAYFRVISDGRAGARQRVVLTSQQRVEGVAGAEGVDGAEGELFERLIEPAGPLVEGDEIEYWFETEDNRTAAARIRFAERPRVVRVTADVQPPEYAAGIRGGFVAAEGVALSRDSGGVAVLQPVLAGSAFSIRVETNKPARLMDADSAEGEGEAGSVGWSREGERTLVFAGTTTERVRLEIELVDEEGLESGESAVVVVQVVDDGLAAVTITDPAYDESVLATARLDVRAEAEDDLGVEWLALERETARQPAGSEGAAAELDGDGGGDVVRMGVVEGAAGDVATELVVGASLDVASIGARAGDEVWLTAVGRDVFAAAADGTNDPRVVRSAVRRLRIIDEATFVRQVQGELAGVRRAAIEIDSVQAALEAGEQSAAAEAPAAERAEQQGSLTDRLEGQRGAIERLRARAARNGLDDATLEGMLEDGSALLRDATEASASAAAALGRGGADTEAEREAAASQERVREDLASLISMLDQGQDNWVARRTIESLLNEQRELAAETRALGEQTMGRSREQLSGEELTELDRIAERQRDAAERARRALDSLAERAEALERFDAAQAQAMSQAARRGRQERVEQQMQEAAAQLDQNQTRAAEQGQQAAAEALEQMLGDIDSADEARDEALRRVLASVLESLEALIDEQEVQLGALSVAGAGDGLPALADPMVRLASNTLGLLDEIGGQRDLASVLSLIGLAADAQERAVTSLRESSVDSAEDAERESLSRLQDARAEAARLEEEAADRESARKRAELRTAYREMLEQQVAIVTDTEPLVGVEVDRRVRAQVRAVGQRQAEIGETLTALRDATDELADAAVFEFAHRRIDRASGEAAARLLGATADAEVLRHQGTVVRLLQALLAALAEDNQQKGGEQSQGGGGGGGSSGDTPLVPELAELKLLRAMQAEAMEWTRNLDESGRRPAEGELGELADLQQELAARAAELVEKLTENRQAPVGGEDSQP
ncbi:MAG: hypothetical protein Q9O74_02345 [Planctomycetota bacterium]|nr:hypothetical protein [Planctomycetota bacterium]